MKLLIAFALVGAVLLLLSLGQRALPDPPDQEPVAAPVDVSIPTLQAPTSTSTSATTPPPTARARTAPTLRATSASRPTSTVEPSDRWIALADCESGDGDGRPPYSMDDTFRGLHHGALQWHPDTWSRARKLSGLPVAASAADAPFADEVAVAKVWLRAASPRQWPVCGPRVGLSMADAA